MGKKTSVRPTTSVMVLDLHTYLDNQTTLTSLVDFDLAAETASLEAGKVSQALAADTLSLANLRPDALPRLLLRQ